MTITIIITICSLLLLAYVFELTASKTRVPSVILLLLSGWLVRHFTDFLEIHIPDLSALLPAFGTIGLILIVLEGSLELEFHKSKFALIRKSFVGSLISMLALAFILTYFFNYFSGESLKVCLVNAIPLCVISSAIAIPSVKALAKQTKEFVIYESSLSDIIGVLLFNFVAFNDSFGINSFGHFGLQLLIMTIVSFVATIGLSFLLSKINHHIKFAPIILLVILIYAISKVYHLPGLIFILLFGLFIGNLDELKQFKWIEKLNPESLNKEVSKFRELIIEGTFLIRAFFFLLFGFLMNTKEILNTETLFWALGIVATTFIIRAIQLKVSRLSLSPLFFIAPRGLISILLFLSIEPSQNILLMNKSLIIQVIILSALLLMLGLMRNNVSEKSNNNIL